MLTLPAVMSLLPIFSLSCTLFSRFFLKHNRKQKWYFMRNTDVTQTSNITGVLSHKIRVIFCYFPSLYFLFLCAFISWLVSFRGSSCPVTQRSQAAPYPPSFPQRSLMEPVDSKYTASNGHWKQIIHSEQSAILLSSEMVNAQRRGFDVCSAGYQQINRDSQRTYLIIVQ